MVWTKTRFDTETKSNSEVAIVSSYHISRRGCSDKPRSMCWQINSLSVPELIYRSRKEILRYSPAYLSFRTESHQYEKLRPFWEKYCYGLHQNRSVGPFLLCEEHRSICFWINSARLHEEGSIFHLNSTLILWYISGFRKLDQRFKLWCYRWRNTRQTEQSYFKLIHKKIPENGKLLVDDLDEPR